MLKTYVDGKRAIDTHLVQRIDKYHNKQTAACFRHLPHRSSSLTFNLGETGAKVTSFVTRCQIPHSRPRENSRPVNGVVTDWLGVPLRSWLKKQDFPNGQLRKPNSAKNMRKCKLYFIFLVNNYYSNILSSLSIPKPEQ